ncbi:hypothetical protein [Photorhabdus akhurstii]
MSLLPVYEVVEPVLSALKSSQQVLLHAPAGAGWLEFSGIGLARNR